MPDTEKSNPPNAPAMPTDDGQAKGTGYGAGGSGSGADRAALGERSSWAAPDLTLGGERTSRAVPDKPEDRAQLRHPGEGRDPDTSAELIQSGALGALRSGSRPPPG